MEEAIKTALPALGFSVVFLAMAVKLFNFLMDSNAAFRRFLINRVLYLEEENKELRQALFMSKDPDTQRLAASLINKKPMTITNLGEPE